MESPAKGQLTSTPFRGPKGSGSLVDSWTRASPSRYPHRPPLSCISFDQWLVPHEHDYCPDSVCVSGLSLSWFESRSDSPSINSLHGHSSGPLSFASLLHRFFNAFPSSNDSLYPILLISHTRSLLSYNQHRRHSFNTEIQGL
ncbi:hypothetical protein BDV12DRAFT_31725 [Aspergillus spectabilis]